MKQFVYQARDHEGAATTGIVESLSDKSAARALQEKGLMVVSIKEKRTWDWKSLGFNFFLPKVSQREITTFTGLLATMLSTGLPLTSALENLVTQTKNNYFKEIIRSIIHDITSGISLSEALGRYPQQFDSLYVNLVKAGEASGKIDEVLGKLAETMEANLDFKAKVKGALAYPAVIVLAMIGIGVFMLTSIIPKIAEVYGEFNADLPLPTRILIGMADFVNHYYLIVILLGVGIFFAIKTLRENPTSEYFLNNLSLKLPVMGALNQELTLTIINRTLGTLLYSGVAILDSLRVVARAMENNYYRSGLLAAATLVEKGLPLSLAIRRNPNFPLIMAQLLAIGEETGTIDQSLLKIAKYYQDITERKVKVLSSLLEPILILVMGAMVGGLAIAVLMPMFNLVNVIK